MRPKFAYRVRPLMSSPTGDVFLGGDIVKRFQTIKDSAVVIPRPNLKTFDDMIFKGRGKSELSAHDYENKLESR